MARQRNCPDRGRRIALEDRPYEVDWLTLLRAGRSAVQKGRADEVSFLSGVMWRGVDDAVVTPRPAALDHPFMRRWLAADEQAAIDYLCDGWGCALNEPEPESADQVRALVARPLCPPKEKWQHFMYSVEARLPDGPLEWYVGYCHDCLRALLVLDDDTTNSTSWWPFYDQETG